MREDGSEKVSELYEKALDGDLTLAFSLWNVGEAIVVFDKYYRRGAITREQLNLVLTSFRRETRRLLKLGLLRVVPVRSRLLVQTWSLILKHGVYVADALQIVSAKTVNAELFVTGDRRLGQAAEAEGLKTLIVG